MSVLDSIGKVFRKCSEVVGLASTLLMPTFFAMSFLILAALCLHTSECKIVIPIAIVIIVLMVVITFMLLAESRKYKKHITSNITSLPLHHFVQNGRRTNAAPDSPEDGGVPCIDTDGHCSLCFGKKRRLRLRCLICDVTQEARNE